MTPRSIGIVGGMSPYSTIVYYREIVRCHLATCGRHSYPRIVLASVSFQRYLDWMHEGSWDAIAVAISSEIEALARAGAGFVVIATNTVHKVVPQLQSALPILHVLDCVSEEAVRRRVSTVALLGTRFTMEDGFYEAGLVERGLRVLLPCQADRDAVHRITFGELIDGKATSAAAAELSAIGDRLFAAGAQAIVLACTELGMLALRADGLLLDTTLLHARGAWEIAVGRRPLPTS